MSDGASSDGNRAGDAQGLTRRGFLTAVGGAIATSAGASHRATAQAETYRFGGEVQAWRGRAPAAIEGEDNPTLQLEAGTDYEVVWENLDGAPHDFTIQDGNGNAVVATDTVSEEGETATLTFTASPEMAQYICTIHPSTMVGSIQVVGGEGAEEDGGPSLGLLLVAGAMLTAVLSPLAFALFLFLNRGGEERPAPRAGD
jgi:plastocyanin